MPLSTRALIEARDTVQSLLEQLGLAAYLFEVEPRTGHWQVRVEYSPDGDVQGRASAAGNRKQAIPGPRPSPRSHRRGGRPGAAGWQSSVLNVDEDWLAACRTDTAARNQLLDEWRKRLQG